MYVVCVCVCVCERVCKCYRTSWAPAKDDFSNLIVNKDEETVRERTEPPTGPERERRE